MPLLPRKRGRPRHERPQKSINLRVPLAIYQAIQQIALQSHRSLAKTTALLLLEALHARGEEDLNPPSHDGP